MSRFSFKNPITHTPTFTEYIISVSELRCNLKEINLTIPCGMFDSAYYFTNAEGWAKILSDMAFKSNLYKSEKFDCDNFAVKAMSTIHERYGLNAFGIAIGDIPQGRHAFNILWDGVAFCLFEPNGGFGYGGAFPIEENGYKPEIVII